MIKNTLSAGAVWLLAATPVLAENCAIGHVDLRGDWGQARFSVELADSARERATGLMNRSSMARSSGMVFLYDDPQPVSFWMKNTLIPLDLIFMDEFGTVTHVHENAVPLDLTPIPGGDNVLAVLEINAGLVSALGISPGSQLRYPELKQSTAVWPCSAF